jgi:hypothetical protein
MRAGNSLFLALFVHLYAYAKLVIRVANKQTQKGITVGEWKCRMKKEKLDNNCELTSSDSSSKNWVTHQQTIQFSLE